MFALQRLLHTLLVWAGGGWGMMAIGAHNNKAHTINSML